MNMHKALVAAKYTAGAAGAKDCEGNDKKKATSNFKLCSENQSSHD
jgi:hypothetical protein